MPRLTLGSKHRSTSSEPILFSMLPCFWTETQSFPPSPQIQQGYPPFLNKGKYRFHLDIFVKYKATIPGFWMGCVYFKLMWCVSNHFYCEIWDCVFGNASPKLSQVNENFPSVEERELHIVLCIGIHWRHCLFAFGLQWENKTQGPEVF